MTEEPYVAIGGLFVVSPLEGSAGRFADAGSGGGGLLLKLTPFDRLFPTPCEFKAAIRAESDVN